MSSNIGIIIQARVGSSRLPFKMVRPFYKDKGILEYLIINLQKSNLPIVIATSDKPNDKIIEDIAIKYGIRCFRGSETDVLKRFMDAATYFDIQKIIRVCGDNPFLDVNDLNYLYRQFSSSDVDYWCFCKKDGTPSIKTHYGYWAEGVALTALEKVASLTSELIYREHVTNYIYTHVSNFKIHKEYIPAEIEKNTIRLTVDTYGDFDTLRCIVESLKSNGVPENAVSITKYIIRNSVWMKAMREEINKNLK